jgi:MFS family permease
VAEKRRLPVLQNKSEDEAEVERPPWHWSAIGVVAIFLGWLPLVMVVDALLAKMAPSDGENVAASTRIGTLVAVGSSFALACFGAGYLIGRFGDRAGKREATVAGAAAAVVAWLIGLRGGATGGVLTWAVLLVVLVALAAPVCRFGASRGLRARLPR